MWSELRIFIRRRRMQSYDHFPCRHCHKVFKYERNLREHVYGDHPPTHYCFLCDDRLPNEHKPLQFHMTTVHKLADTITCDCCDATFARKSIFDNHCKEVRNKAKMKHATPVTKSIRYRDPILSAFHSVNYKKKVKAEQPARKEKLANELLFRVVYSNDKIIPRSALPILAEAAVGIINAMGLENLGIRVKSAIFCEKPVAVTSPFTFDKLKKVEEDKLGRHVFNCSEID
ncbi:hypothetical protein GCK72_026239 [Caenorhabditis remanei]|uniref:C2H2-type domain-containing protein n=1 Tax=Caenorhabditis remanei TaxID=31234 RepID=A0A6A5G4A1_CAERE|nr:hypothetical protein GCK72_026239 [Caenorhabditis remanei]KAF1749770.1 hypothetical protein GCK72_026239 [Caenorhabditis remanei]